MTNNPSPRFDDPLESLLADALIQVTPPKRRGRLGKPTISDFKDHDQWFRTRCIALYHLESSSLLGNFAEYRHKKDPTARWLQKEEGLTSVDGSECVSGPQWVEWGDPEAERLHRAEEELEVILDLCLPEMGLRAFAVPCFVVLAYSGIHRVELADATQFHSDDRSVAITLPKRLNVLTELSLDCKLALREEVGI